MSETLLCPVCFKPVAKEDLQQHINNCLDKDHSPTQTQTLTLSQPDNLFGNIYCEPTVGSPQPNPSPMPMPIPTTTTFGIRGQQEELERLQKLREQEQKDLQLASKLQREFEKEQEAQRQQERQKERELATQKEKERTTHVLQEILMKQEQDRVVSRVTEKEDSELALRFAEEERRLLEAERKRETDDLLIAEQLQKLLIEEEAESKQRDKLKQNELKREREKLESEKKKLQMEKELLEKERNELWRRENQFRVIQFERERERERERELELEREREREISRRALLFDEAQKEQKWKEEKEKWNYPQYWQRMKDTPTKLHIIQVALNSTEWKFATRILNGGGGGSFDSLFINSGISIRIDSIQRIQNTGLWQFYQVTKNDIELRFEGRSSELEANFFFDDINASYVLSSKFDSILKFGFQDLNLDGLHFTDNIGLHFTHSLARALQNSPRTVNTQRLLICRVIVGQSGTLHQAKAFPHVYDSGRKKQSLVVFKRYQAYPLYLVTLRHMN